MEKAIIGKKIGMTQIFDADGKVIPVTVIQAGPCTVVQKKTAEKDGYEAVQLGYEDVAEKKLTKPELGHLKKAGVSAKKVLKEFQLKNAADLNVGDEVKVDVFAEGDRVDVTGISKGHGYQGVIKRHGAHRLKETHGSGPVVRHAGSMGANSSPSKIFKGKIGAGQMGDEQVTVQNLDVVKVDPEYNLIAVRGAIPGPKGANSDPSRIFKGKIGAGQMGNEQVTVLNLDVVKVDAELGILAVRGAIPGPKGGIVYLRNSVINVKEKGAAAGISSNPQKASARVNPQKASARNK